MYVSSNGVNPDKVRASGIEKILMFMGFEIIGIILVVISSWDFKNKLISIFPFGIVVGVILISLGLVFASSFFVKYKFTESGVLIKYPIASKKLVPWNDFQQVCVCYSDYGKYGGAFVVIACVRKGAKKNMYGRWKTSSPFSQRTVITMDYTQELYDEVKEKCPYEIVDLRNTKPYKLNSVIESDIR